MFIVSYIAYESKLSDGLMKLYQYKIIDYIVMILSEQTEVTELHLSDSVFKLFWKYVRNPIYSSKKNDLGKSFLQLW